VLGAVDDLAPIFSRARCMVVPLRYGAGIKGKIGTAYTFGLPVVATSVGADGMGLLEGRDYLRADTAEAWAEALARLATDEALWTELSQAGRAIVRERYAPERIARQMAALLESL
jgi:O-antigen biosynthesis protein